MRHTATASLLAAALLAALGGCGQMGPLYMPEEENTERAANTAPPAQPQPDAVKS